MNEWWQGINWAGALDRGVGVIAILVLLAGAWKGIAWLGRTVLVPLRDVWVSHLQTLDSHVSAQTETLHKILSKQEQHGNGLSELAKAIREMRKDDRDDREQKSH